MTIRFHEDVVGLDAILKKTASISATLTAGGGQQISQDWQTRLYEGLFTKEFSLAAFGENVRWHLEIIERVPPREIYGIMSSFVLTVFHEDTDSLMLQYESTPRRFSRFRRGPVVLRTTAPRPILNALSSVARVDFSKVLTSSKKSLEAKL